LNIVAFHGSPRAGGNTEILLCETLKAINRLEHNVYLFTLNRMDIKPCQNCGGCDDSGVCTIRDGMEDIYDAVRKADRVVVASPIFFFGLSAQAKIMIDRCQAFWCEKYLLKKPIPPGVHGRKGLLLLVGGMKNQTGITCGEATAKAFFRSVNVQEHETLSFLGVDRKGAIIDHPTALHQGFEAGKRLVRA
jgi:multimeric flavodoxin WrbA